MGMVMPAKIVFMVILSFKVALVSSPILLEWWKIKIFKQEIGIAEKSQETRGLILSRGCFCLSGTF